MVIQTPSSPATNEDRTAEIKRQVGEVTEILSNNVELMKNRGEAFDSMQAKSNDIEMGSDQFRRQSGSVARRQWWQLVKFKLLIVLALLFLIGCGILGFFFWDWRNKMPKNKGEEWYSPVGNDDKDDEAQEPIINYPE